MRPYLVAALLSLVWAQTDITPTSPSRTDTTVQGSVDPNGPTFPGPMSGPKPGTLYLYTLRECLDSLYVRLCNAPSGSDMEDTYLQIINLTKACTVRTGLGYCPPSFWPFPCPPFCPPPGFGGPQAGIKLYHDPAASGTNNLLFAQPAPMRLAQGDQLLIIVQPEFEPNPTDVLTFELQVNEYRYPNAGGNPAAGLPTPSIAPGSGGCASMDSLPEIPSLPASTTPTSLITGISMATSCRVPIALPSSLLSISPALIP